MNPQLFSNMAENEERHWWFVARRRIVLELLARERLPDRARILDIGAGTGGTSVALTGLGDVEALEIDDAALAYLRQRSLAAIHTDPLPDPRLPAARFDLITALDVLEHIEDDLAITREVSRLLTPGGCFLATVPAHPGLWTAHDEHHHHFRRYTRRALSSVIESAGLQITYLSPWLTALFPLFLVTRLYHRYFPPRSGGVQMPSSPVNHLLTRITALEASWIGRRMSLPLGASWIVLAHRRHT